MFGSFTGASDAGMQDVLVDALVADRIALFRRDAFGSLALILLSAGMLLWAYLPSGQTAHARAFAGYGRKWIAAVAICVLSLANLFVVGKRYLDADDFTTPKDFNKPFALRTVDEVILTDKDPQYRVLDLTVNVFNSSVPSYHHKNVGGYSPAKLQRYQDLIEHYLTGEINGLYKQLNAAESLTEAADWMAAGTPVLNALNTRYVILDGDYPPLVNDAALGAAWFVDSVVPASSADEELSLLASVDLRRQAVVRDGTPVILTSSPSVILSSSPSVILSASEESLIGLTSYAPNELHYRYSTATDRLAVFSEIWYPNGWTAVLEDGTPVPLFRADWTLRAALLPAGDHELVMRFLPDSYRIGATVSRWTSLLLLLVALGSLALAFRRRP